MTKPNLSVSITARDLTTRPKLAGIRFEIQSYSFSVQRGPYECRLRAYGDELALRQLFSVLRGNVEITDGAADPVWWGCLWSVNINNGAIRYGRTLENMGNSINIVYLLQTVNQAFSGSGSQATTGFSADATSVAEFGTVQKRLRGNNGSATAATSRQTRELANRKNPQKLLGAQAGARGSFADIVCKSWMQTLDWVYYTNSTGAAAGFEQNAVITSEAAQFLGRAHPASTKIRFTSNKTIERTDASWAISNVDPYRYIYFTGTTGGTNDKAWQITTINAVGANYFVTPTNVTTQALGPSITTHDVGTKIYQTFTLSTNNPFYAASIDIRAVKVGAPTDNITVKLYTDNAGVPNVLLATGTILNSEVPSYMAWVTAGLNTPALLAFGTTYGIEISRSGSEGLDCFQIGVDTALSYSGGSLFLYTGSTLNTWVARPTNADLEFKVAGFVETTQQISNIVGTSGIGQYVTTVQIDTASGLRTVPYQDGTLTALQVIDNLVKYGTSNNLRLLMKLLPNRTLVLYEEPAYGTAADMAIDTDGLPRERNRNPIPKYKCPYGRWAEFIPLELYPNDDKYVFIDVATYDGSQDSWAITQLRDQLAALNLTGISE